jgi:hypothetical protein
VRAVSHSWQRCSASKQTQRSVPDRARVQSVRIEFDHLFEELLGSGLLLQDSDHVT